MQPFGHNGHGPKIYGGCAFLGGAAAGFPSNTMWPGQGRGLTSFILIHPTIWPQYTNVIDRQRQTDTQDRTDRHDRQRSDSIGWTVLQTVAQKWSNVIWPRLF